MSADYFFRMGKTHTICQDYAIAGSRTYKMDDEVGTFQYAILSDGCSGKPDPNDPGSPYTDFGARFLTRAAQKNLKEVPWLSTLPADRILAEAESMARAASLPQCALDATLLVAVAAEKYARTFQFGDGVVVSRERGTGKLEYKTRKFGDNMPYYLSYTSSFARQCDYKDKAKTVTTIRGFTDENGIWSRRETTTGLEDLKKDAGESIYSREDTDLILLLSDGAESFFDAAGNEVPLETVLTELMNFKNYSNAFVKCRCDWFFKTTCENNGWVHKDDFSMAGIFWEAP